MGYQLETFRCGRALSETRAKALALRETRREQKSWSEKQRRGVAPLALQLTRRAPELAIDPDSTIIHEIECDIADCTLQNGESNGCAAFEPRDAM